MAVRLSSLSPYLFILYVDALSRALRMVVQGGELDPYWPVLGVQSLSHLLFADDCLLIGRASLRNVRHFVFMAEVYCRAFGQCINLQKSTIIFSLKMKVQVKHAILDRLGIPEQTGTLTYLGVPITGRRLRRVDCRHMEQRI